MKQLSTRCRLAGIALSAVIGIGMLTVTAVPAYGAPQANAQNSADTASGVVTDTQGEPLIGATVMVKGTSNGTATDIDGNFTLKNAVGKTLVITYIGYKTLEIKGSADMKVELSDDTALLDEVVVVGYGVQKKGSLTALYRQWVKRRSPTRAR